MPVKTCHTDSEDLLKKTSYKFDDSADVFLVRIEEIEEPTRKAGVKKYRSIRTYLCIKLKMLLRIELPAIQVRRKEKTETERYIVYDGFHRYHISKEMRYKSIAVSYIPESLDEFLVQKGIPSETFAEPS
jgi:hypothetical protein